MSALKIKPATEKTVSQTLRLLAKLQSIQDLCLVIKELRLASAFAVGREVDLRVRQERLDVFLLFHIQHDHAAIHCFQALQVSQLIGPKGDVIAPQVEVFQAFEIPDLDRQCSQLI